MQRAFGSQLSPNVLKDVLTDWWSPFSGRRGDPLPLEDSARLCVRPSVRPRAEPCACGPCRGSRLLARVEPGDDPPADAGVQVPRCGSSYGPDGPGGPYDCGMRGGPGGPYCCGPGGPPHGPPQPPPYWPPGYWPPQPPPGGPPHISCRARVRACQATTPQHRTAPPTKHAKLRPTLGTRRYRRYTVREIMVMDAYILRNLLMRIYVCGMQRAYRNYVCVYACTQLSEYDVTYINRDSRST